jgi:hypothetical protein
MAFQIHKKDDQGSSNEEDSSDSNDSDEFITAANTDKGEDQGDDVD